MQAGTLPLIRLAGAALWLTLLLWLLSGPGPSLLCAGLAGLAVALPVWLTAAALSAIRAAHDASQFVEPGHRLTPRLWHLLRLGLALPVALTAGASLVLWHLTDPNAPLATGLGLAATLAAGLLADHLLGPARRGYARPRPALRWGIAAGVAATLALFLLTAVETAPAGDLAGALAAASRYDGTSRLLGEAVHLVALGDAALGWLRPPPWLLALLGGSLSLPVAGAALLLPRPALARILAPTDAEHPRPTAMALAVSSAAMLILPVASLHSLAMAEAGLLRISGVVTGATPTLGTPPDAPELLTTGAAQDGVLPRERPPALPLPSTLRAAIEAERIGDLWCPPGTIDRIEVQDAALEALAARGRAEARAALVTAFDGMRDQVPAFLDWYYSLGAEYLRTANLLIGNGEDYLAGQLADHLGEERLEAAFLSATDNVARLAAEIDARTEERAVLFGACTILPPDASATVTATLPASFALPPVGDGWIAYEMRIGGSLGAGAIASLAIGKVVAKAGLSSTFRLAAATLAKVAGSKALTFGSGVLIGATGGGAAGSVIPGAGTTAGAVLGGLLGGAAVMIGVDWTLLRLEEEVSRDGFAASLLEAIDAAETETLQQLGLD